MTTATDFGLTKASYTIAEAAEVLSISKAMLFKIMRGGQITSRKIGCRTIFLRADLEAFLLSLPTSSMGSGMGSEHNPRHDIDNA